MLLNRFEKAMMLNPVRALIQRHYEAAVLEKLGGRARGQRVLEVGCGSGRGVQVLLERFGASEVDAFDLDPHMVTLARRRLAPERDRVHLWQGSVTEIRAGDASYDAVFDFGILHHVPDYRRALSEIFRVLRPGGRFFAEEVLERFIVHPVWRTLLDHPQRDRFDRTGFVAALESTGFVVRASQELLGAFAWFVADKP
ncbi:MAG: class I SAM-dependent methyltransferase [Polyangiaceae bacterium]